MHSFKANEEGELEFKRGDVIEVLERNEDGWWKGSLNGRQGIFPSNYVSNNNNSDDNENENKDDDKMVEKEGEKIVKDETVEGTDSLEGEPELQKPKQQQQRAAFSYLPPGGLQVGDIPTLRPTNTNISNSNLKSPSKEPESVVAACSSCGCDEYKANVFRPGHCNNCFHKH